MAGRQGRFGRCGQCCPGSIDADRPDFALACQLLVSVFHSWYATCPRGAEPALEADLAALGAKGIRPGHGGVRFTGEREVALRACLDLRTALRVLERKRPSPAIKPPSNCRIQTKYVQPLDLFSGSWSGVGTYERGACVVCKSRSCWNTSTRSTRPSPPACGSR